MIGYRYPICDAVMRDEIKYGAGECNLWTLEEAWQAMGANVSECAGAELNDQGTMMYRVAKRHLDGDTPTVQERRKNEAEDRGDFQGLIDIWMDTFEKLDNALDSLKPKKPEQLSLLLMRDRIAA